MKRISLKIKIIVAGLAIWIPYMLAAVWYNNHEAKNIALNQAREWSITFGTTISTAINTLIQEGKMNDRFQMAENMSNTIDGIESIKIIDSLRYNEIINQISDENTRSTENSAHTNGQEKQTTLFNPETVDTTKIPADEVHLQVMRTGKPVSIIDVDTMRTVTPYRYIDSSCSKRQPCDNTAQESEILGLIDMSFSIRDIYTHTDENIAVLLLVQSLAGLIIIMTLLFAVNSIFLKRINNFRNAINKLATGDLTIRLPTEINDEIGDAAYDFNAMAAITEHQKQNLEEIVSSRTRELTMANERLMLSRDEALSASHTKSEFLSTMSHEIRTPLNGVIGMLSLLRTLDTDPERLDYLETAYNSGHVLLTLLNDILDISKIEANKIQLEQVNFDLKHTVNGIITLLGEDAQRKSLDLSFHIPSDYPSPIKGDPTRLRQILTNLISNSIKFTESGFVDLTINTIKLHKYFVLFEFKITDSGIGINEENQSKVFGKFAQSDNSITRKYGGSGLGLAIVKELVAKMGGSIKLTSELGKGSVFAFTLPFNIPAEETIKPVVNKSKTIKIIISSDYNDEAQSYLKEFESHGWEVDLLGTDEDPLPLMLEAENNNHPYHIAILEKKNSQAASIALASLIRKNQNLDNLKIITVNEIGQRGDGQIARLSGMSGYLVKPIPPSLLSKCVIDVINTPLQSTSELITRHSIVEKEQLEIKQNSTNNQTKKKTILLVEDNPVNQKIAQAMLGKLGHDVIVAENGQIAVEAAANGSFDLILMDCQMPVMDGYEATKTIRQNEQATNSRIPIVAMTANAYPEDIEKCMASGMDGHLTKPVDMSTLNKTVESYLYSANTDGLKSLSQG